jgi:hypothetical protein
MTAMRGHALGPILTAAQAQMAALAWILTGAPEEISMAGREPTSMVAGLALISMVALGQASMAAPARGLTREPGFELTQAAGCLPIGPGTRGPTSAAFRTA